MGLSGLELPLHGMNTLSIVCVGINHTVLCFRSGAVALKSQLVKSAARYSQSYKRKSPNSISQSRIELQNPDPGLAAARLQCRCVLHHDRPCWFLLIFPRSYTAQPPLGLRKQTSDPGFEMPATQDLPGALQAGLARHDCRRLSNTSTPHRRAPQLW